MRGVWVLVRARRRKAVSSVRRRIVDVCARAAVERSCSDAAAFAPDFLLGHRALIVIPRVRLGSSTANGPLQQPRRAGARGQRERGGRARARRSAPARGEAYLAALRRGASGGGTGEKNAIACSSPSDRGRPAQQRFRSFGTCADAARTCWPHAPPAHHLASERAPAAARRRGSATSDEHAAGCAGVAGAACVYVQPAPTNEEHAVNDLAQRPVRPHGAHPAQRGCRATLRYCCRALSGPLAHASPRQQVRFLSI
jgi:hypothetical protein